MDILYTVLKTTTPDLWGKCNNIHLSFILRDWPVGPSIVMAGGGDGGRGLWRLHVGHHGDPCTFRPEGYLLPPPDSSVVCTYKRAGTLTYENSLPLYV